MSKKNVDDKNRYRSKTVAFRASPEEAAELDLRYRICGYETKQEFILDSLFKQKVLAKGNPQMLISMRQYLRRVEDLLKQQPDASDIDEIKVILKRILEVLEGF